MTKTAPSRAPFSFVAVILLATAVEAACVRPTHAGNRRLGYCRKGFARGDRWRSCRAKKSLGLDAEQSLDGFSFLIFAFLEVQRRAAIVAKQVSADASERRSCDCRSPTSCSPTAGN
jgi:hypothetical protein